MKTKVSKMSLTDIKVKANALGIKTGKLAKKELIHQIQSAEGFTPCFETGKNDCKEMDCIWREDCIKD